jgi:hypothetical protein
MHQVFNSTYMPDHDHQPRLNLLTSRRRFSPAVNGW